MYDHIGLRVKDLSASVRFYGTALAAARPRQPRRRCVERGLRLGGRPRLWLAHAARRGRARGTPGVRRREPRGGRALLQARPRRGRARQWRARAARRLRAALFRGVPRRSRRQQRRSGLPRGGEVTWHPSTRRSSSTRARERVWDAVRDVGAIHDRLAPGFVIDTVLEDGGAARVVTFGNGMVARELIVDSTMRLAGSRGRSSAAA